MPKIYNVRANRINVEENAQFHAGNQLQAKVIVEDFEELTHTIDSDQRFDGFEIREIRDQTGDNGNNGIIIIGGSILNANANSN